MRTNLDSLSRDELKERLLAVIKEIKSNRRSRCGMCARSDPEFMMQWTNAKWESPAFRSKNERWYHLALHEPVSGTKSGYKWRDCEAEWENGALVAAGLPETTLQDAMRMAERILSFPQGKLSQAEVDFIFAGEE